MDIEPVFVEERGTVPAADSVARFEALYGSSIPDHARAKTYKFIRWREIIEERSAQAELVIWCGLVQREREGGKMKTS
jgi:hypothetical protein